MDRFAFRTARLLFASGLCSVACSWAGAETLQLTATADLQDYFAGSGWISVVAPLTKPVLVHQGDHVDLTVHFLPGQALQLSGVGQGGSQFTGWLLQDSSASPANSSVFTVDSINYALIGQQGHLTGAFGSGAQSGGASQLGPSFSNLLAAGDQVTFTGYHVSFDVVSLQNGSSQYGAAWAYFRAPAMDIVDVPVPEPGTAGLWTAGVLLLSLTARPAFRTRDARPARRPNPRR